MWNKITSLSPYVYHFHDSSECLVILTSVGNKRVGGQTDRRRDRRTRMIGRIAFTPLMLPLKNLNSCLPLDQLTYCVEETSCRTGYATTVPSITAFHSRCDWSSILYGRPRAGRSLPSRCMSRPTMSVIRLSRSVVYWA